jgi:hypothetical protein
LALLLRVRSAHVDFAFVGALAPVGAQDLTVAWSSAVPRALTADFGVRESTPRSRC